MARMNGFAGELSQRPISMPHFNLAPLDDSEERKELARKLAEARTVRAGAEAWAQMARAQSFTAWVAVGRALSIGKQHCLHATGARNTRDRRYCLAFSKWMKACGFTGITPSVRSHAIEVFEHLQDIETWRKNLSDRQRRRLIHPLAVLRRWRAATMPEGKSLTHLRCDARAALKHFLTCLRKLPTNEASMLMAEMLSQTRGAVADVAA
jgi:hypothetical protein